MGDGSKPAGGLFDALLNVGKRVLTGESIFLTHFTNRGAGKRTAILLEDPVEPELMYRCADYLATSLFDLLGWLGVED